MTSPDRKREGLEPKDLDVATALARPNWISK